MSEQPRRAEVHPIAGVTADRMAELAGPLGWGDACRLLKLDEAVAAVRGKERVVSKVTRSFSQIAQVRKRGSKIEIVGSFRAGYFAICFMELMFGRSDP